MFSVFTLDVDLWSQIYGGARTITEAKSFVQSALHRPQCRYHHVDPVRNITRNSKNQFPLRDFFIEIVYKDVMTF